MSLMMQLKLQDFSIKNKNKNKMGKQAEIEVTAYNIISSGTKFTGDFFSDGNVRIDGAFSGNISIEGKLIVGVTGSLVGKVECRNAELEGKVDANMEIKELLVLKSSAVLTGDIVTNKLSIEQGSHFVGNCKMI